MNNYFIPGLSPAQKEKLKSVYVHYCDFTMGSEAGVVIEHDYFEAALQILEAKVSTLADSIYQGIQRVVIEDRSLPTTVGPRVSAGTWTGKNQKGLLLVAEQVFVPFVQMDVVISSPRNVVAPQNDGRFHIHLYSSPAPCNNGAAVPNTIWGLRVSCTTTAWPASRRGVAIYDGSYAVAELVGGNNLYVHHDLANTGSIDEQHLFAELLQRVLSLINSKQSPEQARRLFIDECSQGILRYLPEALAVERAIAAQSPPAPGDAAPTASSPGPRRTALEEKIRKLNGDLSKLVREARLEELKLFRNEGMTPELFGEEYEALLKVKQVTDVRVEGGKIVVYTTTLKARDPRNHQLHEIGAFKIVLDPQRTSPQWFNQTRLVNALFELQQAPHVWNSGNACLGNTEAIFADLFAQRQWSVAAQVAIRFIESVNLVNDRAGPYIVNWPACAEDPAVQPTEPPNQQLDAQHMAFRQEYINACASRLKELCREASESLVSLRKQIEALQAELVGQLRIAMILQRRCARARLVDRDELAGEYENVLAVPKVRSIQAEPGVITVFTEPLHCKGPNPQQSEDQPSVVDHEIGSFHIKIFLDGQADLLRWYGSQKISACCSNQQAPLVLNSGRACLSDLREAFPDLIANFQIATLVQLAIDFIEQVDVEHPAGKHFTRWPKSAGAQANS